MTQPTPVKYTLTLDDDPMVPKMIAAAMNIKTIYFSSSAGFLSRAQRYNPAGIFIDIDLGVNDSGLDLIPNIRQHWPYAPIIVITGNPGSDAVASALATGANDFVRKPIDPRELVARFQTRAAELALSAGKGITIVADVHLDRNLYTVTSDRATRHLSHSDFNLLHFIAAAQGTVLTKDDIKRHVWGEIHISNNALDKKIFEIRQALKDVSDQVEIKAIYGKGLKLQVVQGKARQAA